jgi:hypothetical protein
VNNWKILVYWNLRHKCWSMKDLVTGKVAGYANRLTVRNAEFKVSEAGRQRVLTTKTKNVHAGVAGTYNTDHREKRPTKRVRYNPYTCSTFVDMKGRPVRSASLVWFESNGRVYARHPKEE